MDPSAMRPYALAMQAYHRGDHTAELLIRRDDGYEDQVPIAFFFREPDAHIGFQALGWMTRGQLLCLPMIVLGIYLIVTAYRRAPATP